jgi:general secretion pathway protein D
MIADPATSKLIVYDTRDNIDSMQRALDEIDAAQETRAYALVHVDAEGLSPTVEALLTEAGRLSVDPRSNTLIIQDRPDRLDRIGDVVMLLDQELQTRSWVVDYADPVEVANNIAEMVPEAMGSIVVNESIHQITVTATPYRLEDIDKRITAWDEKRRQVQIEAYLATVSRNIVRDLGINWRYATTLHGDPLAMAVGSLTNLPTAGGDDNDDDESTGGGSRVAFNGSHLDAVVRILNTSNDATILAHPRITVQDGEEASFENTTSVPFASSTMVFNDNSNFANSNTTIDFIDVGTVLRVIPRISSEDSVLLNLEAEDSTFVSVEVFANGEVNTLPQKTQNRAETQVLVRDSETIVLGGLRTSNLTDTVDRIPILGEIPFIGRAFRTTGKDHQDRELLIFLTPTIIGEITQPETVKLAQVEDGIAEWMRRDSKTTIGRLVHKVDNGEREFTVSIGQSGGLLVEGEPITIDGLRVLVPELEHPTSKTMVIREHPAAPGEVAAQVTDIAMEHGLKIEFDDRRFPFVPRASGASAPTDSAAAAPDTSAESIPAETAPVDGAVPGPGDQ